MSPKAKILVVDDDDRTLRLIQTILTTDGYEVITAKSGIDAVALSRTEKPDLITMDIFMPQMDGYTACMTIKNEPETKSIPIVMLTILNNDFNAPKARKTGADGYITKPFTAELLTKTVSDLLPVG
jgi:CheY-like chemotaxis protein